MRMFRTLCNDIKYQMKYGFYVLYLFISVVYILALAVCPEAYKKTIASLIIFTDPAMLGMFFIGGIWLLEKGEGIHRIIIVSPLRPIEYILSKAISLGLISTLTAIFIALIGLKVAANYFVLSVGIWIGSMIFTMIGMLLASYANSVNQYILYITPPSIILAAPAILVAFGITHPLLEILPGTALWHLISYSIGMTKHLNIWIWVVLLLWLGIVVFFLNIHIPLALQAEGGEKL